MEWLLKQTDEYETFWHVTSRKNIDSILKSGLLQTISDDDGDGVYCIVENLYDTDQLENVLNFMEQNGEHRKDLVIVEFEYLGEYFINDGCATYENHQWIRIPSNVPSNLIDKVIELDEI
ncbi:hypothetical protein AXI59_15665 [Bacillus nakamurai]|uniref:hypothetical protein n=1 Tax=Bacillus nakamurai TaxID=1793963 RepID=UPI0007787017|nr:hypothetical protein [Bacillus nakamurai]KXZ18970.1 hypothetical protein AXI59_15665 [Bacillus nakamurai]